MDKEILQKIKETFDISIKMSALLMPIFVMQPQDANKMGVTIDDILYLNKNYYDINSWLNKELEMEEEQTNAENED